MDVSAFVQENKRWLLCCLLGVVVFFIARSVIGSVYDPTMAKGSAMRIAASVPAEVYGSEARQQAQQLAQQLAREREQLVAELGFEQREDYLLAGKALAPDEYLGKVGRELKLRIQRACNERDVEIRDGDRGLSWPSPTDVEQIRAILLGLDVLDETAARLFAAHDAVRESDPQAMGLVGVKLALESRRPTRTTPRRPRGEVDLDEVFRSERVQFEVYCDAPTVLRFLESLRRPGRTLTIEGDLSITAPRRRGDPLTVKGALAGLAFVTEGS